MVEIASFEYNNGFSRILLTEREELLLKNSALTVFDGNTSLLFKNRNPEFSLVLPPGEAAKSWSSVDRILKRALAVSLGRDSLITAVGGGVVTDIAAFAASIYMRGCRLLLIPTSLLAMVDAAIGGKTGIDFGGAKNLVGTFYPAHEVYICPELLQTLPDGEYRAGLAEVIKHAMLDPGEQDGLWDILVNRRNDILTRQDSVLNEMILKAVKVKVRIVTTDLQEEGQRAFLNLGHTFAHAMESATDFCRVSHGEAVAWGILKALELGERLSITDKNWAAECRQMIVEYNFDDLTHQVMMEDLKAAMIHDKKKKDGQLQFILMEGPGKPVIQKVPEKDLDAVLGIQ